MFNSELKKFMSRRNDTLLGGGDIPTSSPGSLLSEAWVQGRQPELWVYFVNMLRS